MSFVNNYTYTIRRSNKEIFYFYCDNGLHYKFYDASNNLIKDVNIFKNEISDFSLFDFSIDAKDDIYGILSFDNIKIIKCSKNSSDFFIEDIFKFDFQKFAVSYPSIKKLGDEFHIFYYAYDLEDTNSSVLFHIYKNKDFIKEQIIDFIHHSILNEYRVVYIENTPLIVYFNLVDGFEEIFISKFDLLSKEWSTPTQITNTKKNKIYLDAVYYNDFIHLSYCYKDKDDYSIKYMKIENPSFDTYKEQILIANSLFMYPSFITEDDRIYLLWINLNRLYTSYSIDNGDTWYKEILDKNSIEFEFTRSKFLSNYREDLDYNDKNLFTLVEQISFLGF